MRYYSRKDYAHVHTNKNTLRLYWKQIRSYLPSFSLALTLIPLTALLLDTLLPYFFSLIVGALARDDSEGVTRNLMIACGVGAVGVLTNFIGFQALIRHEAHVRTGLYDATFRALLAKDMQFFVNQKVGALTSRFIDFTRAHVAIQDLVIVRTAGFLLSVCVGLALVASSAPLLALLLAILMILVVIQVKVSTKIRAPYRHERKKLIGDIHGTVADCLTNSLIIKTFAGSRGEIRSLQRDTKRYEHLFIKDLGIFGIDGTLRILAMTIMQLGGIAACAYLVLHGKLEVATVVFVLAYMQRLSSQIFALGEMLNGYDQAFLEAGPMSDILSSPTTLTDAPNAIPLRDITPSIDFTDVSYRYSDAGNDVLRNIALHIPAGQKVGLIGHSGSGKTTMTHLLLRFADPTHGSIRVSGKDIKTITQDSLRQQIAYVPQEPMLLHRSLRENIAYGNPSASQQQIDEAVRQANAYEFIQNLPHGLDTLVGERGVKLSGGQRQRIAIARALLKNAPILVLDEATSALDSESEKLIQDALETLMQGRTSIVIAHRLSTIAKLDRIVVLSNGVIAEEGTHTTLLRKKGVYANLWTHQSGGFIEE